MSTPSDGAVRSMSATVRGKHSSRYGDSGADDQREKSKLQCGGITLEDDAAHGGLELKGLAKIPVAELLQIDAVLNEERLIEIQSMAQLRNFSRRGAFAEHLLDRIARNNVNHRENQGEDEPERGESQKKTLQEVARHQRGSAEGCDCEDFVALTDWGSSGGGVAVTPAEERSLAAGRARSIFTRATRLPSISTIVKR